MGRSLASLVFGLGLLLAGCPAAFAAPEFQGRLTGIVIAATLREAIFIEDGATRRLHPGEAIDGWTVASVEPDAVTLTADGATTKLSPTRSLAAESSPAPVPLPARTHQVSESLIHQQRDQAVAEAAMAAETKKMEALQAAQRGNRMP